MNTYDDFLKIGRELISILARLERDGSFARLGYSGCYDFCVRELGLDEFRASYFTREALTASRRR